MGAQAVTLLINGWMTGPGEEIDLHVQKRSLFRSGDLLFHPSLHVGVPLKDIISLTND